MAYLRAVGACFCPCLRFVKSARKKSVRWAIVEVYFKRRIGGCDGLDLLMAERYIMARMDFVVTETEKLKGTGQPDRVKQANWVRVV